MKKIIVVYHIYLFGDRYMQMINEQFELLNKCGLMSACDKLHIGVVDSANKLPAGGEYWIKEKEKDDAKIEVVVYPDNKEEVNTMKWIRDYAAQNPDDYVLYFHTKGITRFTPATEDWRHYLEYFSVENWRDCIQKLKEGYDCCGVMWNTDTPIGMHPHFSGTMWWANTNYINTLDHQFLDSDWRYDREFWIGTGPNVKAFEFHNSRLNDKASLATNQGHYDVRYPRSNYEKQSSMSPVIHTICTVYKRVVPMGRLIYEFILQTDVRWTLHIVHDGPAPRELIDLIFSFKDSRITFTETPLINGFWGFPNRKKAIQEIDGAPNDYILVTNDDNQYLQVFMEYFLGQCLPDVGFVYCNTIHSYMGYGILITEVRQNYIDMGSFIVRLDVAKKVGFNHQHEQADGAYAEECAAECRARGLQIVQINKALYVHN
jgi:hypothetical protein